MQLFSHLLWLRYCKSIFDLLPLMVEPETPVSAAISQMAKRGEAILLVADSQVRGWFSEKDLLKVISSGVDLTQTQISQVMNTCLLVCQLAELVDRGKIISQLTNNQSTCLLVVNEQEQLLGALPSATICAARELAQEWHLIKDEQVLLDVASSNGNFAMESASWDELSLVENTTRFKLTLESTRTIYWERNLTNDEIFFLNPLTEQGRDRQLTHSEVLTYFHPDDRQKVDLAAKEAIASCSSFEVEHRLPSPEEPSQYKWFVSRGTVITNSNGQPTRLIGVSMDISDRLEAQLALEQAKQELESEIAKRTLALEQANRNLLTQISDRQIAQEKLLQSQQILQLIMDTIPQGIFWKDRNSVFLGCNRQFAQMLGFADPQDIVGKTDYDLVGDRENADFYRQCDARVMQTNTPEYHIIEPLLKLNEQQIWLETNKVPLHDLAGNVVGILGSLEDITQRQQAQQALEKSEQWFRFLAESIPQQVWIARPDGYVEYTNQRTLEYFGCTSAELFGWEWQQWIHPEDRSHCLARWQQCLATGANYEIEFRLFSTQSQNYRWHLARALPLRDAAGKITNWFGTNTDIDDHKRVEEALAKRVRLSDFRAEVDSFLTQSYSLQELMRGCTNAVVKYLDAAFARIWILNKSENVLELQVSSGMYTHIDGFHSRIPVGKLKIGLIAQTGKPYLTNAVQTDASVSDHDWAKREGMIAFAGYPLMMEGERLGVIAMFSGQALDEYTFQALGIAAHEIAIGIKRKQTEQALRHSEERFRNLVEASSDWVWEVDENALYTYVSPKVREILGYEPEELLGKSVFQLMPPQEAERVMNIFAPIVAAQKPFKCLENTNLDKYGNLVLLESSGVPIFNGAGEFCGYRGIDRDVTARKQAQTTLQKTQQQLQAILDNSSAVIYVTDTQGRFTLINREYERLFHLTQAEIVGKTIHETWTKEIADEFLLNNQRVIATGNPIKAEEVVPHEDGLHTYLSVKFPLKDASGNIYAICGISTDITERKLAEESLLRLYKAIESTSDAIVFSDVFDASIYINPAFTQLYDYNLEQLQACGGMWAIFHEPQERQQILDTLMKGESWRGEVTTRSRNGQLVQVYLRTDAIKDSHDKIIGTVCIHTDITHQKQVEEGLRLRDRAINASSNGIIIADASIPNGPIIYVNPAFENMTGYSADEVIGQNFRLLQSADIDQTGLRELDTAMQAGRASTVIIRNYRKDGSLLWNELNISPVYDSTGRLTHYIGIQTDITERKQAETALLISQQRLQYLLASSPAVIYTCKISDDYGTTFISSNVIEVTGYSAKQFTENSDFWVNRIHPEDQSSVFSELADVCERRYYRLEYRFLHKDGTYRWLYDQGRLIQDDTNNPLEMVGYLIDISDRKRLEEDLKVALEKEKELGELKSRFVSMTSHEFRTPLSTILSSSELLEHYRHKWTQEKQLTHLHRIQAAVKRMTEMLNDILIIGKAEAGKLEFIVKSFDLVAYCQNLVEEIQVNLSTQKVCFISEHKSMPCSMDDKLLGHILNNLLSNAIKYSPHNSQVQFSFYCRDARAIFEIKDLGIGIPPEDIPHLFESFHRAKNVGNIVGTGLGLAIVKKCVDIHQGEISVSSTLGTGTVFIVNLPLNNTV